MVGLNALLQQASSAGLKLRVEEDRLVIRGPSAAGALAREILERKSEVLGLLSASAKPQPSGARLSTGEILAAHGAFLTARKIGKEAPAEVRAVLERSRDQFHADRREALLSLDETKIRSFLRSFGMNWGAGSNFWRRVHSARSRPLVGLPEEARTKSAVWLERSRRD